MVLIGINGQSGAGKTTLSKHLLENSNRKVIHLDHILDVIKRVLPKSMILNVTREDGEVFHYMSKSYGNNPIYEWLKKSIFRILLSRIINNALKDNYEYLIIEGLCLEKYCNLNDFDYTIFVSTSQEIRYRRVVDRDSLAELSISKNSATVEVLSNPDLYTIQINNDGSLSQLMDNIKSVEQTIINNKLVREKK